MKVVKPQSLVFQAAPFQLGDQTILQTAVGLGFRLSDPRIFVHEAEVWAALAKVDAPSHFLLQAQPKPFAEWLLLGRSHHREVYRGGSHVEWAASVQLQQTQKVISCRQKVEAGHASGDPIAASLLIDHSQSHHGAHCQNPVGSKLSDTALQLMGATGWSADPWAAMGPLEPTWSIRRQFLPRGSHILGEMANAKRGPGAWPAGMDGRYFQQASPGQWSRQSEWAADAPFELQGFGQDGQGFKGCLPGVTARQFDSDLAEPSSLRERTLALKTVIFLPDQDLGLLWWQSSMPLAYATQDVPVLMTLALDLKTPCLQATEIEHFARRRADPTLHDPALMLDVSLMPPLQSGCVWDMIVEAEDHPRFSPPQRDYAAVQKRLQDMHRQMQGAQEAKVAADQRYQSLVDTTKLPDQGSKAPEGKTWREVVQGSVRSEWVEGVTLSEVDLSGLNLSGWSFKRTRFERCNLRDTRWKSCHLEDVSFAQCDLSGASLHSVSVHRSKWSHCQLARLQLHAGKWAQVEWADCQAEGAHIANVHWQQWVMNRCSLAAWQIQAGDIQRWTLMGCDATRWRLQATQLSELSASDVNWSSLHLQKTVVDDMSAVRTNFEGALFEGCRLTKAVLALGCVLDFASLEDCVWQQSTWSGISASALTANHSSFPKFCAAGCKLESSQWRRCDLSHADFSNALLRGAVFEHSSLRDAALLGTDFGMGEVQGCNLVGARLQWASVQTGSKWRNNLDAGSQIHPRRSA